MAIPPVRPPIVVALSALLYLAVSSRESTGQGSPPHVETFLFEFPADAKPHRRPGVLSGTWWTAWPAAGGHRVAVLAQRGDQWTVVGPGVSAGLYRSIDHAAFSPDGRRVEFLAEREKKWHVVVDGVEERGYDEVRQVAFSPDSRRVTYAGKRDGEWWLVDDGREVANHRDIGQMMHSPAGGRFVYAMQRPDGRWALVEKGVEGPSWEWVGAPRFSPDGRRLAYAITRGDNWHMVIDGREGPPFQSVRAAIFSGDGSRVAYFGSPHRLESPPQVEFFGSQSVLNKKLETPARVFVDLPAQTAKGPTKVKWWLPVLDSIALAPAASVGGPMFGPGGKQFLLLSGDDLMLDLLLTGKKIGTLAEFRGTKPGDLAPLKLWSATATNDLTRLAVVYGTFRSYTLIRTYESRVALFRVDPEAGTLQDTLPERTPLYRKETILNPQFSPDARTFAFELHAVAARVVVNGQAGPEYDQIVRESLALTNDSATYVARRKNSYFRVAVPTR